jgi:hypothetical protein
MQRSSLVSSIFAFGLLLAACSSTPPSAAATAQAATCATYAQNVCNRLQECFPTGLASRFNDLAQCMDRTKQACATNLAANGTGATPTTVDACGTAIKNAACDALFGATPLDACKAPAGTLADGTACGDDAQCTNRNCAKTSDPACGTCQARSPAGGGCVQSIQCEDGLFCDATGKCVAAGKQGAACGLTNATVCAADLVCHNGKCDLPLAVGAMCNPVEQACNGARLDQCGANQTCEETKFAKSGDPCGVVNGQITSCGAGGRCKLTGQSGTCVAPAADGQACDAQKGPACIYPASCVKAVCTFPDPNACK